MVLLGVRVARQTGMNADLNRHKLNPTGLNPHISTPQLNGQWMHQRHFCFSRRVQRAASSVVQSSHYQTRETANQRCLKLHGGDGIGDLELGLPSIGLLIRRSEYSGRLAVIHCDTRPAGIHDTRAIRAQSPPLPVIVGRLPERVGRCGLIYMKIV